MGGSRKRSVPVTAAPSEGGGAYVAYFPSGFKAAAPSSASSSAASLPFTLYESTSNKRRRELVAHKDGVSYVGKTVSEEFSAAPPCRYLLGVYNKDNGQLQVSNIAGGSVCRVEVRASKADYSANGMFGSVADVSRSLQNKRLVDAFGSTRRRRQLETAEGARVNAERVGATGAVVSMVAAMAKGAKESGMGKDQVMARVAGKRNIPPHHLDAATPEAAFPLGEVVPEGVRLEAGRLLSASEDDAALEAVRERGFVHSYVVGRLPGLAPRADAGDQDKKERKQRAKALSYLSSLLNLHASSKFLKPKAAKGGVSALAKAARIPQDSMEPLLRSFYEQTRGESGEDVYVRSGVNGELLLSHICLAALLAEGCKMDAAQFEQLRLVLRMTSPELLSRFRELGAKATPVSVSKTDSTPASRKYHLSLLQDGRTLAESLPGIKLGRKGGK